MNSNKCGAVHKGCHAIINQFLTLPLSQSVTNLGLSPLKYVTNN